MRSAYLPLSPGMSASSIEMWLSDARMSCSPGFYHNENGNLYLFIWMLISFPDKSCHLGGKSNQLLVSGRPGGHRSLCVCVRVCTCRGQGSERPALVFCPTFLFLIAIIDPFHGKDPPKVKTTQLIPDSNQSPKPLIMLLSLVMASLFTNICKENMLGGIFW